MRRHEQIWQKQLKETKRPASVTYHVTNAKMIRGGGSPCQPMASMPTKRMGPPPRSLATDAHNCIMVWIPAGIHRIQGCGDDDRYDLAGSPQIVLSVAVKEGVWPRWRNADRIIPRDKFSRHAQIYRNGGEELTGSLSSVESDRPCTSTKPEPVERGACSELRASYVWNMQWPDTIVARRALSPSTPRAFRRDPSGSGG